MPIGKYDPQEVADIISASGIDLEAALAKIAINNKISDLEIEMKNIQQKIAALNQPLIDQIQADRVAEAALIAAQSKG